MWINGNQVVHMVDSATHYTAVSFVRNQTPQEIWKEIRRMWTSIYCEPPDYFSVDQGSNYVYAEFIKYA